MRRFPLRSIALAAVGSALLGCNSYHFLSGVVWEDVGRPLKALAHDEAFISALPEDPRSCELRVRAGRIYRKADMCAQAQKLWETAARMQHASADCRQTARDELLSCPDFFPLDGGRSWTYVDSDSIGKAMRLEWTIAAGARAGHSNVATALFAGVKKIRDSSENYTKRDWQIEKIDGASAEPFLRYPFITGNTWTAKRQNALVAWKIVATGVRVKVAAGNFSDCIKVSETDLRFPDTLKYDYYCPGVGRVKTTLGGREFENPNTELLRFGKMAR